MSAIVTEVEIAVQDAAGVRIAYAGGAVRVELCSALGVGGLTPSIGLVHAAVEASGPDFVHVLIRPRAGGFVYDHDETEVIVRDVAAVRRAGAAGVVIGALTADNTIDRDAAAAFIEAAGPLRVTFHRAFDVTPDPVAALETLRELGVHRVLTSGQASRSIEGIDVLARLVQAASGVEIMAGGGVAIEDIPALRAAGVHAVHLSARGTATAGPSGPGGGEAAYDVTDEALVRAAVAAASA